MIAFLNGILADKKQGEIVVDVSGVGYRVEISTETFSELPQPGKELKILIYHHFTDSDQRLFGFRTMKEKNLFERLITVKGIGPKLGLTILSGMSAPDLMEAIVTQNTAALSKISGIGKKTAQRMVLELKDKLFDESQPSVVSGAVENRSKIEEATSALEALGFKKRDAEQAVHQLAAKNSGLSVSDMVKKALTQLKR